MTELTTEALADALDCFWNATIGAAHERQSAGAMDVASVLSEGISAVSQRLREHAPAPAVELRTLQPVGYVNRAKVESRADPLPLLHYTPTAHFDTAVYFHSQLYRPPATGIARTGDGVSAPFIADCLRRYADILRNGLIADAGHYFPVDIDEAADLIEAELNVVTVRSLQDVVKHLKTALDEIATNDEYRDLTAEEAKAVAQKAIAGIGAGGAQ